MKTKRLALILAAATLALLAAAPRAALGSPGALNPKFGNGGVTLTPVGNYGDSYGYAVSINPANGNIVVAGYAENNDSDNFGVARYTSAGVLDTSFGSSGRSGVPNGGTVLTHVSSDCSATGVVAQSNGNILVCGYANGEFALVRYTITGALDTTFGAGGIVLTPVGDDGNSAATSLAVQPNGNIVVAGWAENWGGYMFAAVRYLPNGALDTSFGSGGKVLTCLGNENNSEASSLALQSNGDIVLAGYARCGYSYDFALARYNSNGTLDTSFGSSGIVLTNISCESGIYSIAIQSNGDIVAGGYSYYYYNDYYEFALARYTSTGCLDTSFGGSGIVLTYLDSYYYAGYDSIGSVAIQSNGDILAGGYSYNYEYGYQFTVARYLPAGALDNTFASGGVAYTSIGWDGDSEGYALAIQANGNIVLVGEAYYNDGWNFTLADYLGSGSTASP